MAALIIPGGEVHVIVLSARFKEMGVIGNKLRHHAFLAQLIGNRIFPDLYRTPRSPQKIKSAAKNIVAGGHARKRPRKMTGEARRAGSKTIKVRRCELGTAVSAQHVPIETVQKNDDSVLRLRGRTVSQKSPRF